MTPEQRTALVRRIVALRVNIARVEAMAAPVRQQLAPYEAIERDLQALIDEALFAAGVDIAGECEGCDAILLTGDRGHRCGDGPILCMDCSPTWADVNRQRDEDAAAGKGDAVERQHFYEALADHIDAGGSPADKLVYEL